MSSYVDELKSEHCMSVDTATDDDEVSLSGRSSFSEAVLTTFCADAATSCARSWHQLPTEMC